MNKLIAILIFSLISTIGEAQGVKVTCPIDPDKANVNWVSTPLKGNLTKSRHIMISDEQGLDVREDSEEQSRFGYKFIWKFDQSYKPYVKCTYPGIPKILLQPLSTEIHSCSMVKKKGSDVARVLECK